jgi:3-oxosteroid 1-dehydrogenase
LRSDFDVIVVGGGLAGIATSLACADRGLSVLLTEKADKIGGAAAYSNGQVWIPANPTELDQGLEDSVEDGIAYVRAIAREHGHPELLDEQCMLRWLHTAPEAAAYYQGLGAVEWTVIDGYPDYFHPEAEGSRATGRYLAAYFDGAKLGEWREKLVVSPHFTMGVTYDELFAKGLGQADTDADQPADFLTWGTGLVGGFLARLVQEPSVTILPGTEVTELLSDDGHVVGIRAQRGGAEDIYKAARAVVVATSSVDWNPELVHDFLGVPPEHYGSLAPPTLTGDGLKLAVQAGANVLRMPPGHAPMVPGCHLPSGEVSAVMQHAQPHSFIVDASGKRFCDDALYWEMVKELLHGDAQLPCFMIWDEQHHNRYGLGTLAPGEPYPEGLVVSADTFAQVGEQLGLDGTVVAETAARFNEHAVNGEDPEFGRGKNATWRMAAGDPSYANPNVGAVTEPPFHGMRLVLTGNAIGLSGIDVDPEARVLDEQGEAIPGLFAAGSCAAFKTSGLGFNSGFPLSRCLTHAYLIAGVLQPQAAAQTEAAGAPAQAS